MMVTQDMFDFLEELSMNNTREWMQENKKWYDAQREEFIATTAELMKGIVKFDNEIDMEERKAIFRLFRDVRFSKVKTPYKEHFGCHIANGGKKSIYAGYYLHVQPGNHSILAAGLYMPQPDVLKVIRKHMFENHEELAAIVDKKSFKKDFGGIAGPELKYGPVGYPYDHESNRFLKKKSFHIYMELTDEQVLDSEFVKYALRVFKKMSAYNAYFNTAIDMAIKDGALTHDEKISGK